MYFLFLTIFLAFSLAFIVRIEYVIHVTYRICVYQLFMLSIRLAVNGRLLVVEDSSYMWISIALGVVGPNPQLVQGSALHKILYIILEQCVNRVHMLVL